MASDREESGPDREVIRRHLVGHLQRLQAEGLWAMPRPARPEIEAAAVPADPEARQGTMFESEDAPGELQPYADATEALADIEREALACEACGLSRQRRNVVFGVGSADARLMFIGEGPGRDEDRQGEPFVGAAGRKLNEIIAAMKLRREDVYIANAVKCRPPRNRNPEEDELAACRHFLLRQVARVRPEVIILLGRVAMQTVLQVDAPLGRMRGRFHDWNGIPVRCTYHPAYLLRNPADRRKVWEDVQAVMRLLADDAG